MAKRLGPKAFSILREDVQRALDTPDGQEFTVRAEWLTWEVLARLVDEIAEYREEYAARSIRAMRVAQGMCTDDEFFDC